MFSNLLLRYSLPRHYYHHPEHHPLFSPLQMSTKKKTFLINLIKLLLYVDHTDNIGIMYVLNTVSQLLLMLSTEET